MQKRNFYNGFFWGTIIGTGIGTVLGLLFAPKKGEDTRRELLNKLNSSLSSLTHENPSEMPVPNSIPPKEGSSPATVDNEAKRMADVIIDEARLEAQRLIFEANSFLREVERANKGKNNGLDNKKVS